MVNQLNWTVVSNSEIEDSKYRLKANVYNIESRHAREVVAKSKFEKKTIVGENGLTTAYRPNICKRIFVDKNYGLPMYTPSSICEIYPKTNKYLSIETDTDLSQWFLVKNELVLTCSGTIGKLAFVSKTLAGKCFSQNLIRINNCPYIGYIYAYLISDIGQTLLKTNNYGAVIQHIDPDHLENIPIPNPTNEIKKEVHVKILESFDLRDKSNELMDNAEKILIDELKFPPLEDIKPTYVTIPENHSTPESSLKSFSVSTQLLNNRFDASYHLPIVNSIIDILLDNSEKILNLGNKDLTNKIFLPGRFKRIYVEKDYGKIFFGGKQLHELDPSNKKYLSIYQHGQRIKDELVLKENMILVTRSGTVGKINIVPEHWENWIANDHIIRITPKNKNIAGYIYVWLNSDYGQALIERLIYGSVVDELEVEHLNNLQIPILKDPKKMDEINSLCLKANKLRSQAYYLEQEAIELVNKKVLNL